jgi:hypothetical protein
MSLSPQLIALGKYLAGEFDNREQALAEPIWYVHLRLWQRPISLFSEDSITLFAEQANIVKLDQPYRQRVIRLSATSSGENSLQAQYYMLKNPDGFRGAGCYPALLDTLTEEQLDLLPGCVLSITETTVTTDQYKFTAFPPPNTVCSFTYLDNKIQVALGFVATATTFLSYDKGIDPTTGKATWGAILGPYRYSKQEQYSVLSAE